VLPALLAGAAAAEPAGDVEAEPPGDVEAGVLAEVDDEELHADATATHAVTRMPKQVFLSFIAMSPLRGRRTRPRTLGGGLARLLEGVSRRSDSTVKRFLIMITMKAIVMRNAETSAGTR
jgi:hypothetical protein